MDLIQAGLRSYSQVLFARDLLVGALLLAATLIDPVVGLHGLLAVAVALGATRALGLPPAVIEEGLLSYNALLFGLGVGALLPGQILLLLLGALATVIGTAALHNASVRTGLPPLALPYLAAIWLALAIAPESLSLVPGPDRGLPGAAAAVLRALGTILFVPRVEAGLLVAVALLRWSRQGALFAAVGFAVAGIAAHLLPMPEDPALPAMFALNLGLVAVALGGVWFVPSGASLALAAAGAAVAGLLTLGGHGLFARIGLPVLIAPFQLTVWAFLLGLRQRAEDRAPKAVDFVPGTPEENLATFRTRLARFGARYLVRLRLPVRGTWTVTQGPGDGPTHLGPWSSAIDLEVAGPDGQWARNAGARPSDHHCWHLPVLATADGTVAKVIDGVRDNEVGEVDLDDNWGNVVILWHGGSLYSMVAHLSPGTLKVFEGQRVRRGDLLGLCGSSGRSPRPHLHFQLQATPTVGAPTLPLELHDVVHETVGGALLRGAWTPVLGDRLRNLVPEEGLAAALGWISGRPLRLAVEGEGEVELKPEIDVYGRRVLVCGPGRLYYGLEDDLLTIYDVIAPRTSVLHAIAAALARLPLEDGTASPTWSDHLSPRALVPTPVRLLQDLIAPFARLDGIELRYRTVRDGRDRIVEGHSVQEAGGVPVVSTRARLRPGPGLIEVCRTVRGVTVRAVRVDAEQAGDAPAAGRMAR